jgi:hypothetical protein
VPYLNCPSCGLRIYTAARHLAADECPKCGTELRVRPDQVDGAREQPPAETLPSGATPDDPAEPRRAVRGT